MSENGKHRPLNMALVTNEKNRPLNMVWVTSFHHNVSTMLAFPTISPFATSTYRVDS